MAAHTRVGIARAEAVQLSEHRAWATKLWERIDRDRNGYLTKEELNCDEFQDALRSIIAPDSCGKVIGSYGRAEQNVQQLLSYCSRKAGINRDGCFTKKEFESFTRELRNQHETKDKVDLIFALFDLDGDQHIDKEEFAGIYRFYLGTHPIARELRAEWERLDHEGWGRVTKERFVSWLPRARNPCFRQHAGEVYGSSDGDSQTLPASPSVSSGLGRSQPSRSSPKKAERIWRPAPGLVPRRKDPPDLPAWNENFACKDPSEQNLAVRGNLLMKTYFSRPQSLPELRRFYKTYQGFDKHLTRLQSPELPPPRKPVLSDETWEMITAPGLERHLVGGNRKNARGEELPWRELTPRALKKIHREPGSMLLRVPMGTPKFMTPWTERRQQVAQVHRRLEPRASTEELQLRAPRGRRSEDAPGATAPSLGAEALAALEGVAPPEGAAPRAGGAAPRDEAAAPRDDTAALEGEAAAPRDDTAALEGAALGEGAAPREAAPGEEEASGESGGHSWATRPEEGEDLGEPVTPTHEEAVLTAALGEPVPA